MTQAQPSQPKSGRKSRPVEWKSLNRQIEQCDRCPRLRQYGQIVGEQKRRAFRSDEYWARPVPNLGSAPAKLLIVGLAPAAHGANRTGRMFTGDQSGRWLFRAMHRSGLCSQPESSHRGDGLELIDCAITAACHCAPPANRPLPIELTNCTAWFDQTLDLVRPKVILALGRIAWDMVLRRAADRGWLCAARPKFAHGCIAHLSDHRVILGCYHPSQQNTFTGRLTESMLDESMMQAASLAGIVRARRPSRTKQRAKP